MKVYILRESDFEALLLAIDRDPAHGRDGGSSSVYNDRDRAIYSEAHGFYNYQVRRWIDKQKSE
jgi:hypothetical protein